MARFRVIVLEQQDVRSFRCAFWLDVPAARQSFFVKPAGTVSAWKDALPGDHAALVSGAVVEHVDIVQVPSGTTLAEAQAVLQATWQSHQDRVTNQNVWVRYGTTWDGTSWVSAGVV